VPKLEIHAFTEDFLDDAAGLLADRHRRHREAEPLLPAAYEEPAGAREAIREILGLDDPDGVVGTRGGRVVGYLIGIRKGDMWGPNVWVEPAGHAAEQAEDVRDLYAAAAGRWVEGGRKAHFAIVPATDADLVDAWFRVGFGGQHAYGIVEIPEAERPDGIRELEERDFDAVIALAPQLQDHQRATPVFSGLPDEGPGNVEELRAELREELESPEIASLIAEQDGRIVGNLVVCPAERSTGVHYGLARPEHASFLGFALTDQGARGSGIGLTLTQAGFAWARAQGYETMIIDWRETNLLASRFWRARGFRPTFLRLHRRIA
jgi:ribosomal protein S18 acetylase RimI-like enzyme